MKFRLADMNVRWSGVDDTTPPGHCLATGLDPIGNTRVWLFKGDKPSDDGYRGSLLILSSGRAMGYGPTDAYVTSHGDHTMMLARLAKEQQ